MSIDSPREALADLAITYLNEKARPYVEPLARDLEAPLFLPLDVGAAGQLEAVFRRGRDEMGQARHSRPFDGFRAQGGFAGGLLDCSAAGFSTAMDVSCHSLVRMAKLAAPLMKDGGTMFAMSYHGANKVVPTYNEAAQRAPIGDLVDIMDVGFTRAFLATPYPRRLSGATLYVDGGVNIMA